MRSGELGFLCIGVAIGAAVAALYTPKSGSQTREMLRTRAAEGADQARAQAERLRNSANDIIDQGVNAVKEQTGSVRAAVDAGVNAYREKVQNA